MPHAEVLGVPLASDFLWEHRVPLLGALFLALGVEVVARAVLLRRGTSTGLLLSNLAQWLVELGVRQGTLPLRLLLFGALARLAPGGEGHGVSLPGLLALYVLVDVTYYWKHRLLHRTRLGWALHAVHHSSHELSLLAAVRLGWVQRAVDDLFYLPLVLLGFPPVAVLLLVELNHATQFWCHTECIGRLGWVDRVLNTPSNHRVHHSTHLAHANFGSTFMLWDRLFGTYVPEPPGLSFGIPGGYQGLDPLRIQLGPLLAYLRGSGRARGGGREPGGGVQARPSAEP
jgi:sterol desaturase/sphingolipid hydroxylase (fatty acid hydroxylase superfamily)